MNKDKLGAGQKLREFNYSYEDFQHVRKLIYEHAGIALSDNKEDMVYSRLVKRLRVNGLIQFKDYLHLLTNNDAKEWEEFTNALTTNLTAFFREKHHFLLLAEHIRKLKRSKPIEIWCCAASTGEEPYSLAITMAEVFGTLTPPVHILATDLDTKVLATAQEGIYPMERLDKLSSDQLKRFFLKGTGSQKGRLKVREELRSMITFRQQNLLEKSWALRGPLNAIFCRNVMIYFNKQTQYEILQKFSVLLAHDGLLFAGHSENFYHAADLFKHSGSTTYEPVRKQ